MTGEIGNSSAMERQIECRNIQVDKIAEKWILKNRWSLPNE